METATDIFTATTMLLSDRPRHPVDALFFHARSFGDDDNLFELAAKYYQQKKVKYIILNGSDGEGYVPGKKAWLGRADYRRRLCEQRISPKDILGSKPALNTKAENEAFFECAARRGLHSAVLLTQPHQILRAFMGMVKTLNTHYSSLKVYALTPTSTNWQKEVYGSQGAMNIPRHQHIAQEFERLDLYQKKGDLASVSEVMDYLKQRESMP